MTKATTNVKKNPSDFLRLVIGKPVLIKLNNGHDLRGTLTCLDGFMNVAMEDTEEYHDGTHVKSFGDTFIRGNNVLYISAENEKKDE